MASLLKRSLTHGGIVSARKKLCLSGVSTHSSVFEQVASIAFNAYVVAPAADRWRVEYPRLVGGRYALAARAEERMAIAVVAALRSYAVEHREGVTPSQGFLAEYLQPFLERELLEARLDELHKLSRFGQRERELLDYRHCKLRECVDRIQHGVPFEKRFD